MGAGPRHLGSKLAHRQAPGPLDPILKRLRVGHARHDHRRDPTERPATVLAGQRRLERRQPVERLAQKRQIPQPAPATPEALARVVVETREAELTPALPSDEDGRRSRQRHGDAIQSRPQRQRHPVGDADLPLDRRCRDGERSRRGRSPAGGGRDLRTLWPASVGRGRLLAADEASGACLIDG